MPGRKARLSRRLSGYLANRVALTIVLVLLVLAGLPVAVWLDLRNLSERALREQADDLSTMIDSIRNYYSSNVVGRVLAGDDKTHVIPNYTEVRGAIPIPATLSLELSEHGMGLDLFIDTRSIDASSAERVCRMLEDVVTELKSRRYTTEADRP